MRVVVLTPRLLSPALGRLLNALKGDGIDVRAVVCARGSVDGRWRHAAANSGLIRRLVRRSDDEAMCRRRVRSELEKIPVHRFSRSFNSPDVVKYLGSLKPDLMLHVHGPIFRPVTFNVAAIGMLNCHVGPLPETRGMNALEWSVFKRLPTGNTIHFVDEGVDTGDIAQFFPVSIANCTGLEEARTKLVHEGSEHLAAVVRQIKEGKNLRRAQVQKAAKQNYRMHPDLRKLVEAQIAAGYRPFRKHDEKG